MKILVNLIIALSLLAVLSCQKEEPIATTFADYDLDQIQSDSNWIKITDTVNLDLHCIDCDLMNKGVVLRSEEDYKKLWEKSDDFKDLPDDHSRGDCDDYTSPQVNFLERDLIGICVKGLKAKIKRNLYVNHDKKEYLYSLKINFISPDYILIYYHYFVSVPKLNDDYKIKYDTTKYFDF